MFEKKLQEAGRKSRQQLFILLMLIVILVLGGAVAFLGTRISLNQPSDPSGVQVETQNGASPSEMPSDQQPAHSKKQTKQPTQHAEPQGSKTPQNRTREEIVTALSRYEEDFEGTILSKGFNKWNGPVRDDLVVRKDKIITELANGETDSAFDNVNNLIADASTAIGEFEAAFEKAMVSARSAYEADDPIQATIQVERALEFKPDAISAKELQSDINNLPQILDLMEKARVARVENNLVEEQRLSSEILLLDPRRVLYQDRVVEIENLLRERQFEKVVSSGLSASQNEQLEKLQSAYEQANKLFPAREETENLASLLKELKRELSFRKFVKEGDTAIQRDNWNDALNSYQNAAALYPDNPDIQETISLSQKILQRSGDIRNFLKYPERLSTDSVREAAERAVSQADIYGSMSPSLAEDIDQLKTEIVRQNTEIEVLVLSDKLTNVSVRSVGKVGEVERYTIRLKPGQYIFEGRREGFRTKSVHITVSPEDSKLEVTVISDERL
ncbi:hypothetical protein [Sneathiella litorea]|uniref:Tetratricopeptide repeat protein n=1 Tax=Sneathiella litorea TaxID=2606216 RepID=A0A6L8WC76_9PROT|nr:hypothetical protein [Sneathiella litorea]MZR32364.1 hypothetical protein [Sneathiella litorea]